MLSNTIHQLIRFRWLLFLLSLILFASSFLGFKQFKFDASPRSYFEEGHAPYERFKDLEDTYGRDFRTFMMLSAKEGSFFEPENMRAAIEATEQAWLLPEVRRVDSLPNFQHTYSENHELIVSDFFDETVLADPTELAKRKAIALNDVSIVNRLVSEDGKHVSMVMTLNVAADDREGHVEVVEAAYALEEAIKAKYPNIDIAMTGNLLSNYHNVQIAIEDVGLMIPLMFALMFILIGTLLGSAYTVIVALVVAMLSAVAALGIGALAGIEYSMLAINALIISITIAIAHCIHIFTQFFVELETQPKMQALAKSLELNFFAVSMTSLTTLVGFLSLNFNDLPPAVALGNAAAIGTFLSWLFSLTILPALVSVLPFKAHKKQGSIFADNMLRLAQLVIKKQKLILLGMSALSVLMIVLSFSNILNDRFSEMIHKPHIFRADTELVDRDFGALYTSNYDISAAYLGLEEGGIADPEYLRRLDSFANYLRGLPNVKSVQSFADVVKRLNQSMHNNQPEYYSIPDSRELIAQYILLYEMSLPFGLDLNNMVTLDKNRSRLLLTLPSVDTQTLLDFEQEALNWQQENLPEAMRHDGAAMSIIWAHLSKDSLTSSLTGSVIALSIISMILLLVLKSWRYGLVSLIPNLIPAAFGFGGWYLYKGEIGLGLTCVVIITIGIVVDDTVHFLAKYKKAMDDNGQNAEAAILSTFKQVGPALCVTTLVLASGFLVLSLSKIVANSALGGVTAMILIAAFVLDVLLLPAILLWIDKSKANK